MRLPTLFKQNKNKTFGYTPRYYDERKERLQKMHEKHHGATDGGLKGTTRRTSFRDDWKAVKRESEDKQSKKRLLIIIALLVVIAVLVLDKYNIKLF